MSTHLDLDDVAGPHPQAAAELAALRNCGKPHVINNVIEKEIFRLISQGKTTSNMTRDERHEFVKREFPNGLSEIEFCALTMLSAGKDEIVDPPSISDWWARQRLIIGLWLKDGLIERRCGRHEEGPFYISSKGKEFLKIAQI